MYVKKVLKRISIFSLAAIVLTVSVFCCFNRPKKTEAAVGAVIAATTALLAFLAAQGLTITFNGVSSDDISSEVNTIMNGYSSGGQTWADWNQNSDWVDWLVGKENKTKFLVLSHEFLSWAAGLPDWLKTTFGLSIGTDTIISGSSGYLSDNGFFLPVFVDNSGWLSCTISDGIFSIPLSGGQSFSFVHGSDSFGISLSTDGNVCYAYSYINGVLQKTTSSNWYSGNLENQNIFCVIYSASSTNKEINFYKSQYGDPPYKGNGIFSYLQINPILDVSEYTSFGLEGSLTDGYQDLQDALNQDLQDKVAVPDAVGVIDVGDVAGVTDDQITEKTFEKIVANDLDISGVGVGVYDDTATVEEEKDAEKAPTDVEMDNGIVIVDGLEDFFPFCIPFDFIAILEQFNAEPEAPKFTVEIGFGGVFEEEEIEIDLSPFETAAEIFRILMIIGFAILLILKTRDLIRG